jgi:RHS repeat-associated protein
VSGLTQPAGVVDLSLPDYRTLVARAGVDPDAESARVAQAVPDQVRGAGLAFGRSGGELDAAWQQSMGAQQTIGQAFTNNGAPVLDRSTHVAGLPAGFEQAGTRLAGASRRMLAVADELGATQVVTTSAVTGLHATLRGMREAWAARVAAAGTLAGGLIPEAAVAGLLAERDRVAVDMTALVTETGRGVVQRIRGYEIVINDALRLLADQGFVPLTALDAPPPPLPTAAFAGDVDPTGFGLPLTAGYAADPVNTALGNFVEVETDLSFHGVLAGLTFARTYNSRSDRTGPFGARWSSWASTRLVEQPWSAEFEGPDGQRVSFARTGAGFGRAVGIHALVERGGSGLTLAWFDGRRWDFDAAGRPERLWAGPGTEVRLQHDEAGHLVELVHQRGRRVALEWDPRPGRERVLAVVGSDGRRVEFRYDEQGALVEAAGPAGPRRYRLDASGLIESVTDPDGVVELVNTYDEHGRVHTQLSPFGRLVRFGYEADGSTVVADDVAGPGSASWANTYRHDGAGRLVAAVDGNGHTQHTRYDRWGNPVQTVQRGGAVTRHEFDERARPTRRSAPSGAVVSAGYDEADRLVTLTVAEPERPAGEVRFRYEGAERRPSEIVDAEGGVTRMTVAGGLVHAVTDPDGVTVRFGYDRDGNLVEAIDAAGGVTRIERDPVGLPVAVTSSAGRRTELVRDARGLVVRRRDPAGGVWRYTYTPAGRPAAVVDPTGSRTEVRRGHHGQVTELVDALGAVTFRQHDVFGNVSAVTTPDGATWTAEHDALSRLVAWTDPTGATWRREYDVDGHPVAVTDPTGVRATAPAEPARRPAGLPDGLVATAWDRCGRPTADTGPDGGVTRFAYTAAGRLRQVVSPAGRTETLDYDACGRLATRVDGAGGRWEHRYDADGLLVEIISPAGLVETFTRDAAGRLLERVRPGFGATRHTYDASGRVTAASDRGAGTRRFGRDPAGRATTVLDALGNTTCLDYDVLGRLVARTDPAGARTERSYDPAGRLIAETDPLGRTTRFVHDAAGRLLARTDPAGVTRHWDRDRAGRVVGVQATDGSGTLARILIERDRDGRPIRLAEPDRALTHELSYDRAGRLREHTRTVGDATALTAGWTYDEDGCRVGLCHPDGSSTRYRRDGAGRLVALHHPVTGDIALARDPDGRLTDVRGRDAAGAPVHIGRRFCDGELAGHAVTRNGVTRSTRLTRDEDGRVTYADIEGRLSRFDYDAAGQLRAALSAAGEWSFGYDPCGRLVRETGPAGQQRVLRYDPAGQLLAAGEDAFTHDPAGRRVSQRGPDRHRRYGWDALGRLTHTTTVDAGGNARTTRYTVDALGELAAVDGVTLLWDTADPVGPPVWLDGGPVVGLGEPWALGGAGAPDLLAPDWMGPDLLAPDWQGSRGAGGRDPWGAGPNDAPALGYRGELGVDGLVWLRQRCYDPATRGFLSVDPLPPVPGTAWAANPYHYAGNDPVNRLDPLGLRPMTDAALTAQGGGGLLDNVVRSVGGGALALTGLLGSFDPNLHTVTGVGQTVAAFVAGERDPGQLARAFVDGPTTTFGQGLGLLGGGDLSYDEQSGLWVARGADWGFGRAGTTYGSTFVTGLDEVGRPLLHHESVHADQYARYGGGIGFPIAYFVEELMHPGAENRFEQEAGLEDGGYR